MTKEITTSKTFEENLKERLREDVGRLMPDEKLSELVEKGVQNLFFTRRTSGDSWNKREEPSWFEKEIEKLLTASVQNAVKKYMDENGPDLLKKATDIITARGPELLGALVLKAFRDSDQNIGSLITQVMELHYKKADKQT